MKKMILVIMVTVLMSIPAAAYASQSITEKQDLEQQIMQENKVNNHEYKQQLWLDSSEEIHSNAPQLWL